MSDAPEHIWATGTKDRGVWTKENTNEYMNRLGLKSVEYIRADLYDNTTLEAAAEMLADEHGWVRRERLEKAVDRIEQLERKLDAMQDRLDAANKARADAMSLAVTKQAKLAKAVANLNPLVRICEMMRDGSGFRKDRYQHEVTESQWSAWCKQVKTARATLAELEGGE